MKSSRKAATPLHALANYAYAILETEATIVLQAFGFAPGLGILHTDKRYRGSLAADLMEPGRPVADEVVLELLETREFRRGVSTRRARASVDSAPTLLASLPSGARL